MKSMTMSNFKKKLSHNILEAADSNEPIEVRRQDGKSFIVIQKSNWLSYEKSIKMLLGEDIAINKQI